MYISNADCRPANFLAEYEHVHATVWSMLTRRLQVLVDDERYERLSRRAAAEGTSIATLVREAIDARYPSDDGTKRAAADAILAAEPISLPDDPADLKREILQTRSKWG